jgi:phosphoesterase RecJ-like protein
LNKEALKLINESRYILIVTHVNPDLDTLSCSLALSNYFKENKIKHTIFNKMKELPRSIDFLSNYHKITDQVPNFYDLIITVDCANIKRVGIELQSDVKIINFDHHQSNDNFGTINLVDDSKASSAEVVYEFFEKNKLKISKEVASCLYVGIYDDSNGFTTPRSKQSTFAKANHLVSCGVDPSFIASQVYSRESLAKYRLLPLVMGSLEMHFEGQVASIYVTKEWLDQTGASYQDCEEFINMVLRIGVVKIAMFLRYSKGVTRVSLRSKDNIDVSKIASNFDGGGHKNAAGCTCKTDNINEAKQMLLDFLKEENYGI